MLISHCFLSGWPVARSPRKCISALKNGVISNWSLRFWKSIYLEFYLKLPKSLGIDSVLPNCLSQTESVMHVGSGQGCRRRFSSHFASGKEDRVQLFEQYTSLPQFSAVKTGLCQGRKISKWPQAVVHYHGLISYKGKRKLIPGFPSFWKIFP